MLLAINYPSWIHPEIFPGVPFLGLIRWYGLMYIFAFAAAFFAMNQLRKEGALNSVDDKPSEDELFSCFTTAVVCLLIGARVFSTIVYDTSGMYRQKPWLIFWPFDSTGHFTGLAGMSYHGGFIGCNLGVLFWCIYKKKNLLQWFDVFGVGIPAGYTFGRIGNFLNGELYGRITSAPWGVIFPNANRFSYSLDWVQDIAASAKLLIPEGARLVNLPRHPSQLYEALFEGLVLFLLLWRIRHWKPFHGYFYGLYTLGYGLVRFFIEYFREPDTDIGYRFSVTTEAHTYFNESLLNISTGQILCLAMITAALLFLLARAFYIRRAKHLH
jgi:phosphatidylglycerol:prolipoprotein diacylglycerol transferase